MAESNERTEQPQQQQQRFDPLADVAPVIAFNKPLIVVDDATTEGMESMDAFDGAEANIQIQVIDLSSENATQSPAGQASQEAAPLLQTSASRSLRPMRITPLRNRSDVLRRVTRRPVIRRGKRGQRRFGPTRLTVPVTRRRQPGQAPQRQLGKATNSRKAAKAAKLRRRPK